MNTQDDVVEITHSKEISSPQNPLIREVTRLLTKSKARRNEGRCIIEGIREVERAIQSGVVIETIFYRPELFSKEQLHQVLSNAPPRPTPPSSKEVRRLLEVQCNQAVFQKIAYRAEVPNLIAIAQRSIQTTLQSLTTSSKISQIPLKSPPLILILEGIEKSGNLGAILRSADALGVTGVILVDCLAELDHPNTIRNSLGASFALDIATMNFDQVKSLLITHQITPYVTHLHAQALPLDQLQLTQASALILGAEATGVSDRWLHQLNAQPTVIPMMEGRVVDSFNVSVAAALVMYEASRQRRT